MFLRFFFIRRDNYLSLVVGLPAIIITLFENATQPKWVLINRWPTTYTSRDKPNFVTAVDSTIFHTLLFPFFLFRVWLTIWREKKSTCVQMLTLTFFLLWNIFFINFFFIWKKSSQKWWTANGNISNHWCKETEKRSQCTCLDCIFLIVFFSSI